MNTIRPPAEPGPEEADVLLRRVDWRFLLGSSRTSRVVRRADAVLTKALEMAFDDVDVLGVGSADRDVAVLSAPSNAELRRAHQRLVPGGSCYAEWSRPGLMRRARRRRLEGAGFTDVRFFWQWPPPHRRPVKFWVPSDDAGAVHHFLDTRPRRASILGHAAAPVLHWAWRVTRVTGLLAPECAIGRKATDDTVPAVLIDELRARWFGWGLGVTPFKLAIVMLAGGRSRLNKVVLLVFAEHEPVPRLAVKVARVAEAERSLEHEARSLRAIAETAAPGLAEIPRIVACETLGGVLAVCETAVTGEPLIGTLSMRTLDGLATDVCDVLAGLARGHEQVDPPVYWERLVTPVLDAFAARFDPIVERRLLDRVGEAMLRLPPVPLVPEHRDCSPWNVLITSDRRIALLDWESAEPNGLPVLDLVYFLSNAAFVLDGTLGSGRERETYRRVLESTSHVSGTIQRVTASYCRTIGLDAGTLPALRAFTWMVHAPGECDRIRSSDSRLDKVAAARRSVFLSLWLEEVTRWAA